MPPLYATSTISNRRSASLNPAPSPWWGHPAPNAGGTLVLRCGIGVPPMSVPAASRRCAPPAGGRSSVSAVADAFALRQSRPRSGHRVPAGGDVDVTRTSVAIRAGQGGGLRFGRPMFQVSTSPHQPGTWRFTLFGIPVAVHWMFWVVVAILSPDARGAHGPTTFSLVLIWVVVALVSILVHEFGHALFQRRFGGRPRVFLYGMGGLAISDGRFSHREGLLISAAGPGAGLVLGAAAWVIANWVLPSEWLYQSALLSRLFQSAIWINIVWSIFNLLPILPMDGGHILEHLMGGRKAQIRGWVGVATAALCGVVALQSGWVFMAVFLGFLAYQNYQLAQPRWR